ncbi:MAG: cytochrome b5 domain-containing protein [Candidatus Komeilibacteria bacterium]
MSIRKSLLIIPILLILTGCSTQTVEQNSQEVDNTTAETTETTMYTIDEIAQHNSKDSCWLLIDNKVYDVTKMIDGHGGGEAILEGCGIDSTELYFTRPMGSGTPHSPQAQSYLPNFYIGELQQ